jgi:hypothetical protein
MNISRNVLAILSMVLLVAVLPQASSSSIWRETDTGPDELASQYSIISASSNAGPSNAARTSSERSSGILADDKVRRRQVKSGGKKAKLPVVLEAKPSLTNSCGPTPSSPLSCSGPPVSDGTEALTDVCSACADETMTASMFEKLRIAPTLTCSALGYKALFNKETSIPPVECLSSYLEEAEAAKTADQEIDYDQVMIDFCVHQCSQEYWDGLASELKKIDVNAFILETCKTSFVLEISDTACKEFSACEGSVPVYTAIGDSSCVGGFVCQNIEYATIGKSACVGYGACSSVKKSIVGDNSCDDRNACNLIEYATIGKTACLGHYACSSVKNSIVGDNSCVSASTEFGKGACFESVYATIGTKSCLANDACSGIAGTSDKPVTIGNGSCTAHNSCKAITVDVGEGSCTYAYSCSCDGFADEFPDGFVPPGTCTTAGEGRGCCRP